MGKKIKVLIVSLNSWDDNNSFGSSFSNIFGGGDNYEIANIFCENGAPNTVVCRHFFQITAKSILKSLFNRRLSSGKRVYIEGEDCTKVASKLSIKESKILNIAKLLRWQILFWVQDLVWATKGWRSKELDLFITDFNPDIIFQPVYFSSYVSEIGLYAKRLTEKPMLGYVSDDCYTYRQFSLSPLFWIDRAIKRQYVKRAIDSCEMLYTITESQKIEYSEIFGIKCKVLFKGGEFAESSEDRYSANTPLRFVYTGNLGDGRCGSLANLARVLSEINRDRVKAQLFIYSMTILSSSAKRRLNIDHTSFFCGGVPASELPAIQKGADVLIHVESFKLSERYSARLSFSTKIVDYLEARRSILAIGWSETGAIQYLNSHGVAVVVSDKKQMYDKVLELVDTPQLIEEYARRGFECGRENHQIKKIRAGLYQDIRSILL